MGAGTGRVGGLGTGSVRLIVSSLRAGTVAAWRGSSEASSAPRHRHNHEVSTCRQGDELPALRRRVGDGTDSNALNVGVRMSW